MPQANIFFNGKPLLSQSSDNVNNLKETIAKQLHLSADEFYLTQNGKLVHHLIIAGDFHLHLRLIGGKGGFGSMLRAIGAQIEKTTNREACRDLSGRRLRDINEEKRVKAYMDKQKEREEEAAQKVTKKIEKLQAKPKHEFRDKQYDEARSELTENISAALEEGLKKVAEGSGSKSGDDSCEAEAQTSSGTKRKVDDDDKTLKKKKKKKNIKGAQWMNDDLGSSSDSESDTDSSNSRPSTSSSSSKSK